MKRTLGLFAAGLFLTAGAADAATVVVAHPKHHTVAVRHVRGHPNKIMMVHAPEHRPGQFWHRGVWHGRVHAAAFRYPHGWHYRVWGIGMVLPALFLAPDYDYDDYAMLGLQAPPPGYRWVRYGPDLLLVNVRTGDVEDVVQDVFD